MLMPSSAASDGDLGQHPGPVGHRDAQLGQLLGPGCPLGQGPAGRRPPGPRTSSSESRSRSATRRRMAPRASISRSRVATMASALSSQMSGQIAGLPGGDPGHVPEAAGGQLQQGGVLLGPCPAARSISVAAARWGTWETTATSASCWAGARRHHVGAEVGEHARGPGVGRRVGGAGRGEHPGGPHEEVAGGPVQPHLLGAGHRVAADEARVVDGRHQRSLDPADVGDDHVGLPARSEPGCSAMICGGGVDRGGHDDQLGLVVDRPRRRGRRAPRPGPPPRRRRPPRSRASRVRAGPARSSRR